MIKLLDSNLANQNIAVSQFCNITVEGHIAYEDLPSLEAIADESLISGKKLTIEDFDPGTLKITSPYPFKIWVNSFAVQSNLYSSTGCKVTLGLSIEVAVIETAGGRIVGEMTYGDTYGKTGKTK